VALFHLALFGLTWLLGRLAEQRLDAHMSGETKPSLVIVM
jgi:hypothetical protein